MAGEVSQHQVAAFTGPNDGEPNSADSVRTNDEALRGAVNAHDGDASIHHQSSLIAARPAPGTPGRVWITTDATLPFGWFDTGSTWQPLGFLGIVRVPDGAGVAQKVLEMVGNRVRVGDFTGSFPLDLGGTTITLNGLPITPGANNSGGAGARVLTVPNA